MSHQKIEVKTDGVLSFDLDGDYWHLKINGEPLYLIGTRCGTCNAIFERVRQDNLPITPRQLSDRFQNGLEKISQEEIDTIAVLLPKGEYRVGLLEVTPRIMTRENRDRTVSCEADYYWLCQMREKEKGNEYEMILPLASQASLDQERISFYKNKLADGQVPTALALSFVDGRIIRGEYHQTALAHFLLDGHHKIMAASELSKPITLMSFLATGREMGHITDNFPRKMSEYYR
jgi:hypothetical protein